MTESPLLTADPEALTAIFSADPLTLSDAQLQSAVLELRRRRNAFMAEEAAKALKPKATKVKPQPQSSTSAALNDKPPSELSLDDLD